MYYSLRSEISVGDFVQLSIKFVLGHRQLFPTGGNTSYHTSSVLVDYILCILFVKYLLCLVDCECIFV
jgi:hypothetical protein